MSKHIGIVACSAEGAALCYRTICGEAPEIMGNFCHPEISMHTYPLSDYMNAIYVNDWEEVAKLMLSSANKLAKSGADFAICPDNTIHQAFKIVKQNSTIPWLHIAECVAEEAFNMGYSKLALTGTKYLMTGPVYSEILNKWGINFSIPTPIEREKIDKIIFEQLVYGNFTEESRLFFNSVINRMKEDNCDAVIMGCTEIPLLIDPNDCPLPSLDSTRLLARAALRRAIEQ